MQIDYYTIRNKEEEMNIRLEQPEDYHEMPKDDEVPFFLAQELIPCYWGDREGTYCPPKGYFMADENPEDFDEYEKTFPNEKSTFNTICRLHSGIVQLA